MSNKANLLLIFLRELINPLYAFILYSCSVWIKQEYIVYAVIVMAITVLGIVINLSMLTLNQMKMYRLAFKEQSFNVLRQ